MVATASDTLMALVRKSITASLSSMVIVTFVNAPSTPPPVALVRLSEKVISPAMFVSLMMGIRTVWVITPGLKVTVRLVGVV